MKFACDRCNTRYSIADDKVKQKVLKIRCKACGNVITVQESGATASGGASVAPSPPPPPVAAKATASSSALAAVAEWHISVNGQVEGPLAFAVLVTRIQGTAAGDDVHIWSEHIDAWKEPKEVPVVAAELAARRVARAVPLPPPSRSAPLPVPPALRKPSRPSGALSAVGAPLPAPSGSSKVAISPYPDAGDSDTDDRTAIQSFDASMLMAAGAGRLPKAPAGLAPPAPSSLLDDSDFPALPSMGVAHYEMAPPGPGLKPTFTGPSRPSSGLESLDFGQPQKQPHMALTPPPFVPEMGAPVGFSLSQPTPPPQAGPFFPLPGTGPSLQPGQSGLSSLSQIVGRPGFFDRNPAVRRIATGGILATLVVVVIVLSLRDGPSGQALGGKGSQPGGENFDPDRARREAEAVFRSQVGVAESVPRKVEVGGRRPIAAQRPVTATGKGLPMPVGITPPPTGIEPPPAGAVVDPGDGSSATKRFALAERKVAAPRAGAGTAGGQAFDQSQVSAVVRRKENQEAVKVCYDRALKRDSRLSGGRVNVTVTIGGSGIVKQVQVDAAADMDAVGGCIKDTVKRWRFPGGGEEYDFQFPFVFQRDNSG